MFCINEIMNQSEREKSKIKCNKVLRVSPHHLGWSSRTYGSKWVRGIKVLWFTPSKVHNEQTWFLLGSLVHLVLVFYSLSRSWLATST